MRLALTVIADRRASRIDLLTYHEGEQIEIPGVTIHRIRAPRWLCGIRPGISLKKLLCDLLFLIKALRLVHRSRRDQYQLIHAVEESVFIAWLIKGIYGIPYIYDMDSSLALQVSEKWTILKPFRPLLDRVERIAITCSSAVVPVCDALAAIAARHGSTRIQTLYDISLLEPGALSEREDLRASCGIPPDSKIVLYIGNLESYQGIDLLIESFALVADEAPDAHLVIIGGHQKHIEFYLRKALNLSVGSRVHLLGTRPVSALHGYLLQATVLASPRIKGNNTPMKIYSYLHSGVPVLATALPTHTQVLDTSIAKLAPPNARKFGEAMLDLLGNAEERAALGSRAYLRAEERYTFAVFQRTLNDLYDALSEPVVAAQDPQSAAERS